MREPLSEYVKLGINHNMLFRNFYDDPGYHLETFLKLLKLQEFEVIDGSLPYGELRPELIEEVIKSEKELVYNAPHLPVTKLSPSSLSSTERAQAVLLLKDQLDAACQAGANSFILVSGPDPGMERREEGYRAFVQTMKDIDEYLESKSITEILIESFDRHVDVKFLSGPTQELVQVIKSQSFKNVKVGIELDMAHVPAIGESFEDAIESAKKHLYHIHLGNCVISNRESPWFGDKHPPIGYPDGEVGKEEVKRIFTKLLEVGYISSDRRGRITLETRCMPGLTYMQTIDEQLELIHDVWLGL